MAAARRRRGPGAQAVRRSSLEHRAAATCRGRAAAHLHWHAHLPGPGPPTRDRRATVTQAVGHSDSPVQFLDHDPGRGSGLVENHRALRRGLGRAVG